ncbi:thymidine kinase [Arsenicicoccus dermatophilus]|uniref:thymidine kinase n=1 Tax=Arsenicicoccus dermatophilus TaxID=1076331 RepID=UPI001F4C5793|nr:thymidine kinase [Arsenicicoccus dermatophilus]
MTDAARETRPAPDQNPLFGICHLAPAVGRLRFHAGLMGAGKSALAIQVGFHRRQAGRPGLIFTSADRAGGGTLSSRLGMSVSAREFDPATDFVDTLGEALPPRGFVIVDEAQFLTPGQVEQLARVVDEMAVDVDCFGLLTAFDSRTFPGSQRLVELADDILDLVEVLCWCGQAGRVNARIEGGRVIRSGSQVAVGDLAGGGAGATYRVLCRRHWREGDLGRALLG